MLQNLRKHSLKVFASTIQPRNFSTIHKLDIAKPITPPGAKDLLNQYPRHDNNSIGLNVPGNIVNPFAAAAGNEDFIDPTLKPFSGLNIAKPISKGTSGSSTTAANGGNIGIVGKLGESAPTLEQNSVTCTG